MQCELNLFFSLKFVCLAVVLCVSAAPQAGPRQQEQYPIRPQANAGVEPLQAGAEDGKDLKGSNSYGYGFYGGYPGYGFGGYGGYGSPYGYGYGYSSYYGYPYYRNFGGLYGGYWY